MCICITFLMTAALPKATPPSLNAVSESMTEEVENGSFAMADPMQVMEKREYSSSGKSRGETGDLDGVNGVMGDCGAVVVVGV